MAAMMWLLGVPIVVASLMAAGNAAPQLKDQFGRSDAPRLHAGRMVALIYGKPSALRRMKSWELKLNQGAGAAGIGYDVVRALDARAVKGKKTETEVDQRLRQDVPPDISILIDWNGELIREYALPVSDLSVTLIDPKGRPCGTTAGPVNDDALKAALDLLARAHQKGSCP